MASGDRSTPDGRPAAPPWRGPLTSDDAPAPNRNRVLVRLVGILVAAAVIGATGVALLFGMEPFSDCDRGDRMTEAISQDPLFRFTPRGGVEESSDVAVVCDSDTSHGLADRTVRYTGRADDLLDHYLERKGSWSGPKHSEYDDLDLYCFDRRHPGFDRTINLTLYVPKAPTADGEVVYEVDVAISLYSAIGLNSKDAGCG